MCLFTSALRASVNKSHIPSLPQNNLYILGESSTISDNHIISPLTSVACKNLGDSSLILYFTKNHKKVARHY